MDATSGMSAAARQLQQEFMQQDGLVQQYYGLYNANRLQEPHLSAFREILGRADQQNHQQSSMLPNQQMQQQHHSLGPGGLQQFQQRQSSQTSIPSPQPSYNASPRTQQQMLPSISKEQIPALLDEVRQNTERITQLTSFLSRPDVPQEKRDQANVAIRGAQVWLASFQERIKRDPALQANLAHAAAQKRQQTASPVPNQAVPQMSMQNPNFPRARSPSNVPSNAPTPPPGSQQARSAVHSSLSSQAQAAKAAQVAAQAAPPPRPGSTAPSNGSQQAFNPVVQGSAAIADDISSRVTQSRPESFPNARPTLSQGLASQPTVSTPAITRPPAMLGAGGSSSSAIEASKAELHRLVPRKSLRDIVATVDPGTSMDEEVEDLLLEIADEFIESVTKHSCALAVHRKGDRLEVKDIQLHLDRVWGIHVPGFASDDVRQSQARRLNPPATQLARAAAVREAQRARRAGTL